MSDIKPTAAQQAVIDHRGGPLLVAAAAGSGKTRVLVERLTSFILDENDPKNIDEFLMITYTKAAASELRGRILSELQKKLRERPDSRRLQRQITRLYLADISTVHSFCAKILREYACLLDIPADFRVAEEAECAPLRQKAMRQALSVCYTSMTDAFRAFTDTLGSGRDDRNAVAIAEKLYEKSRTHRDPAEWLRRCAENLRQSGEGDFRGTEWGGILFDDAMRFLEDGAAQLRGALRIIASDDGLRPYTESFQSTLDTFERLRALATWDELCANRDPAFDRLRPVRKCEDAEKKETVRLIRTECIEGLRKKLKRFSVTSAEAFAELERIRPAVEGAAELVSAFAEEYRKEKKMRHILDFSDLEHEALRLLYGGSPQGETAAARQLSARYREVMVDEYQDTNGIQDAIFRAVSGGGQKLFMVGDVKQSIYRFRLADPQIFLSKYRDYAENPADPAHDGRKILLSQNFRSRSGVLACANDVFFRSMSVRTGDLDYGEAEALKPGAVYPETGRAEAELHIIDEDLPAGSEEKKPEKSQIEAFFAAKRIAELLSDGTQVTENGTLRAVRPEDIAILLRSPGTSAEDYLSALRAAGIPCYYDSGSNILDTTELQVLSSLLTVVDNPHQDIPLLSVLASPLFGFDGSELARIRSAGRNCDFYDALRASEAPKAQSFLRFLSALRDTLEDEGLTAVLNRIMLETGLLGVFRAMENGAARVKNIESFYALAASHSQSGGELGSFLKKLEGLREKGMPAPESAAQGAVLLTSIHKSKGLEYPIVLLCGLSKRFNTTDLDSVLLIHPELGAAGDCVDPERRVRYPTAAKRAVAVRLRQELISEEMRILYVAMTRAKELLILCDCRADARKQLQEKARLLSCTAPEAMAASASCLGDWILNEALNRTESGVLLGDTCLERSVSETPWKIRLHSARELLQSGISAAALPQETEHRPVLSEALRRELDYVYPYLRVSGIPSKLTVTQLKGRVLDREASERTAAQTHFSRRTEKPAFLTRRESLSASEAGTAVHLAMQFIDYSRCAAPEGVAAELTRLRELEFLTPKQAQAVEPAILNRFFSSPLGQRVLHAENVKREFKFSLLAETAEGEKTLLQGVTDCCILEEDGITVLDYKTDRIRPGEEAERAEVYRAQLDGYAHALERIFGKPVREKLLYFFATGQTASL